MSFLNEIKEEIEDQIADGEFTVPCLIHPINNQLISIETGCINLDTHEPVLDANGNYVSSKYARCTIYIENLPLDIKQYSKIDIFKDETRTLFTNYSIKDVLNVYRFVAVLLLEKRDNQKS